jgi:hypothetical protein
LGVCAFLGRFMGNQGVVILSPARRALICVTAASGVAGMSEWAKLSLPLISRRKSEADQVPILLILDVGSELGSDIGLHRVVGPQRNVVRRLSFPGLPMLGVKIDDPSFFHR